MAQSPLPCFQPIDMLTPQKFALQQNRVACSQGPRAMLTRNPVPPAQMSTPLRVPMLRNAGDGTEKGLTGSEQKKALKKALRGRR